MVLSKGTLLFWLLSILAIGLACGYLFSSKFCSISIGRRVEKISNLNQTLRKLFCRHTIWAHEYLKSTVFNIPDKDLSLQQLIKNNQEISSIFNTYYGARTAQTVTKILNEQIAALDKAHAALKMHDDALNDLNTTSASFAEYLKELNPTWNGAPDFATTFISKSGSLFIQTIKAWREKNWAQSTALFENNLDLSLQTADELDKGITQQFPHKF